MRVPVWIHVAVGAVLAALTARAALQLGTPLGDPLGVPGEGTGSLSPAPPTPSLFAGHADPAALSRRNIFCSSGAPAPPPGLRPLSVNLRLVGTAVGTADAVAFALVCDGAAGRRCTLAEVGSRLAGGRVVAVREDGLDIARPEGHAWLGFTSAPVAAVSPAQVPAGSGGVAHVAPLRWQIDRTFLEAALADGSRLLRTVRAIPAPEGGLRLLVPGPLLGQLGLERGDVVRSINGCALDTLDHGVECYARLRQAQFFGVSLSRGGASLALEYQLR
jgi:hypothetical protein